MATDQSNPFDQFDEPAGVKNPPEAQDTDAYVPIPAEGAIDSVKKGLAKSTLETALGAKDLLGFGSDRDKKVLDMIRADADASGGWATAGAVGGDIAQLAIPGTQTAKLAKYGKYLPLAGELAATVGQGFLKAPKDGETRLASATEAGVSDLVGNVLFKGLGKVKSGLSITPEAKELIDQGVKLTPGQASNNAFPRTFEYMGQAVPFLSKPIRKLKDEARESFGDVLVNKVNPLNTSIAKAGQEANIQLAKNFDTAYTEAWKQAAKPTGKNMLGAASVAQKGYKNLGPEGQAVIKTVYKKLQDVADTGTSQAVKEFDNTLRKQISAAGKSGARLNPDLEDVLRNMRSTMRKDLGAEDALKVVDSKYGDYLTYKKAATAVKAIKEEDMIPDTNQLVNAMKMVGGETRVFKGEAPLQDTITQGAKTLGRAQPNMLIDMMKGAVVNIPGPTWALRGAADATLGRTGAQRVTQKVVDPVADVLRQYGVTGGTAMAAYDENK